MRESDSDPVFSKRFADAFSDIAAAAGRSFVSYRLNFSTFFLNSIFLHKQKLNDKVQGWKRCSSVRKKGLLLLTVAASAPVDCITSFLKKFFYNGLCRQLSGSVILEEMSALVKP